MDEFLNALVALRSGAGNLAKGVKGAGKKALQSIRDRDEAMLQAERSRNQKMIDQNFGGMENYNKFNEENPMPTTTLGDFFRRILESRGRGK